MRVDMLTRSDRLRGKANRLTVFNDRLAGGNRPHGHFVAQADRLGETNGMLAGRNLRSGIKRPRGHCNVVAGVKIDDVDRRRRGHGTLRECDRKMNWKAASLPLNCVVRNLDRAVDDWLLG